MYVYMPIYIERERESTKLISMSGLKGKNENKEPHIDITERALPSGPRGRERGYRDGHPHLQI